MATTIDAIQIEIQSNSSNAARGIRELSTSLGELKKNGSATAAVKTLTNLSAALKGFADASNATRAVGKLAGALNTLKGIGSVTSVANSLTKLSSGLKALETVDVGRVSPQIQKIAQAVAPLSAIKAGGLGTMVNALSKIGKVTADLNDEKISAFAERIKKLTAALEPLASKMTTVQTGLKAINSSAKSAGTGARQMGEGVDSASLNMSSFVTVIQAAVQWISRMIQTFSRFISQAIEWDGISARFGRGFGATAQENYEWIERLNDELSINIQQFMKYSSVYATMLKGFGVANEDAAKMALGYTELTYDIWAGYNDIYKRFDEAAEAVKSAIAGEVEPIRRAGFTIVEATLEQTAANYGLEISLANATEAQKSYLRYLTLVDQAHSQGLVGTYAKELNTAEGLMRTFSQQLKSLAQAFGSLFLPALTKIMPYLQAFVELLFDAVQWLASLFGIEIMGVDWSGYNQGAGDAIENTGELEDALTGAGAAAKELKNATLGIDELNVISPPSASGGGGAGDSGGTGFEDLDVESLWDDSIFSEIGNQVDKIKEKLEGWMPVIGIIAGALAALGLGALIASIGESMAELGLLSGMLGTLKQTLAGLAILTIEAVLVFMLADEYLESGNLMALVGEALATAAGGYLMYKGFGTKGLVMALAVSMLAQLAAITMNLADGGVDISDPELWIQAAMAVLTGASAGMLAFKGIESVGAVRGAVMGLTAAMSLTLAAITIGDVAADGKVTKENILTALGSTLSAAGFGFQVGGVWGAVIGAIVGLALNIGGIIIAAISADAEKSLEEDLKSRFGNITLDTESLEVFVEKVTAIPRKVTIDTNVWNEELEEYELQTVTIPVSAALDIIAAEYASLENIEKSIESIQNNLEAQNIKILVGVAVTPENYQASIDTYIETAQSYLDQHFLTSKIAIEILNSDADGSLESTLMDFYVTNSGKLEDLGTQLKEAVSSSFVDGEWIPDKFQEALDLQKEIQEILDYASEVEYRATMQNLSLSISGDNLTPESFKDVLTEAKKAIETRLNTLEEVKMSNLQIAIMEYDANIDAGMSEREAKEIYNQTVADIEAAYQNGRVEISYGNVDWGITELRNRFEEEFETARENGAFDVGGQISRMLNSPTAETNQWWKEDIGNGEYYAGIQALVADLSMEISSEFDKIDDVARENLEGLLESLKPTMEDYQEIAVANRKAGESVPKAVRAGLNDYNELAALSGSTDAINYLIGQGFSTDPVFLNTLATMERAGEHIDKKVAEGLLNNLDYVTDSATGLVVGIKDSVSGETIRLTPELVTNLETLGVNLGDALGDKYKYVYDQTTGMLLGIYDSTTKETILINEAGKTVGEELSNGVAAGIEGKETSLWGSITTWASGIVNNVKEFFQIKSPSKVFKKLGGYLSDGLAEGMDDENTLTAPLKEMWNNAKDWWNKKRSDLTYTPSIGSIYDKVKTRWDSARTWWNSKKTKMKEYTPSIGSIYDKVSSRWKNAKDWWNKKKGTMSYTPSIGSLTDKLKSSWNSAKKWWKNNVKLDTKLNIKVPTVKVKWETASAFGKSFKYPKGFDLKFAAAGGIFDAGSLIWAGERGAEVVANAGGGKTGVMNVGQMQDAVYEGVYAAVVAAMRASGGSGSQDVNVYLDGRKIAASVERQQKERGASILGTQVYSYG